MSKPREFWIEPTYGKEALIHKDAKDIAYKAPEQIIKVIEYSHVEKLMKALDIEAIAKKAIEERAKQTLDSVMWDFKKR